MIQKKICMVGSFGVGKTSLVSKFVHSIFSDKYLTTVGVKIDKKVVDVDGQQVTLVVWDLAGDDAFQRVQLSYLRGSSGYLLVADGTRATTVDLAITIQERITAAMGPLPFELLLNKTDLQSLWEVREERVATLAASGWTVTKTSAKSGSGVDEAFQRLTEQILRS